MSTRGFARGIVGSVRLVGVTAAVAAGIAGFASAPTDVVVEAKQSHERQLPQQACAKIQEHAPAATAVRLGCLVIGDSGPIDGPPLFS